MGKIIFILVLVTTFEKEVTSKNSNYVLDYALPDETGQRYYASCEEQKHEDLEYCKVVEEFSRVYNKTCNVTHESPLRGVRYFS